MQIQDRLVTGHERNVSVIVHERERPLCSFKIQTHSNVDREHMTYDVPNSGYIFAAVLFRPFDRPLFYSLRAHELRTNKMQERNAALFVRVKGKIAV